MLWALVKGEQLQIKDGEANTEWSFVKDAIVKKVKEMDSKVLTDILILSTVGKDS